MVATLQFAINGDLPELKSFATKYIVENRRRILEDPTAKNSLRQYPDIMFEIVEAMS